MKKTVIIVILLILLLSSCTQQMTDEEILARAEELQAQQATSAPTIEPTDTPVPTDTPEPTEEPLPTPEPRDLISYKELEDMYMYEVIYYVDGVIRSYYPYRQLSIEDKERLLSLYNDFGITLRYDLEDYHDGRYKDNDRLENVSPEIITTDDGREMTELSYSIEISYEFFNYLVEVGGEKMKEMIDVSLTYVYPAHAFVSLGQTTPGNGGEIVMNFARLYYDKDLIYPIYLEELTDRFVAPYVMDRLEFSSYNGFGLDYGGTWMQEFEQLVADGVFKNDDDALYYKFNDSGLLTGLGYNQSNNDWSDYQLGLWFNQDDFWVKYYNCETVRQKTAAQLEQYQRVNSIFTLEFFYELSSPWKDEYALEDFYEPNPPDISYVYEYIEENYDN